ncbi:MAG: type IV secretory system conjugative DNA transfer family protein [Solirubrobacteraceae bacterium]
MTDPFAFTGGVLGATALASLSVWALQRPDSPLLWRELRFPTDLMSEQVEALLAHIAARRSPVVFVIDSRPQALRFRVGATKGALEGLAASLAGIAPELRLDVIEAETAPTPRAGVRAWWSGSWPLLRTDALELAVAGLLGQLSNVGRGEHLRLVVRLRAARRHTPPPRNADPALLRAIATKRGGPLLRAEILLTITATPDVRAKQLGQAIITNLRTLTGQRGRLRVRRLAAPSARTALARMSQPRSWSLTPTTVLTPAELVPIVALPIDAPRIAGLRYGTAPRLMPALELPAGPSRELRSVGVSTWPRTLNQTLSQPIVGGLQHTAIIGPTGSGKSALIARLVEQDLAAGRGALVVDVKGDLIDGDDGLLARIPEHRQDDVILIDPAGGGPQPGLTLFPAGAEPELTADLLLGTLAELYRDSWGIRTSSFLSLGLRTLAHSRGASLPELSALFTDRPVRNQRLREVSDPLLLASWQRFEALTAADQATQLAPALRKLDELCGRARLRVVLGQAHSRLHFGEVLARGRIVLVRLPPGLLGTPATRLLAGLLLWQFFAAVEARAALPAAKRRPFMAYIDEVAALGSLPLPLGGLLERARGLGVGLTIAPQNLGQLSPALRSALLANVGSLVVFRVASDDAKLLARELPGVSPEQLSALGRFEIALKLSLGPGHVTPTMTGRTLPLGEPCSDPEVIRRRSAERFGMTLEDVDAALAVRLGLNPSGQSPQGDEPSSTPVGARRRAS